MAADYFIDTTGANGAGTAAERNVRQFHGERQRHAHGQCVQRPGPGNAHGLRAGRRRRRQLGNARLHDLHHRHGDPHDIGPDGDPQPDQPCACHRRHDQRRLQHRGRRLLRRHDRSQRHGHSFGRRLHQYHGQCQRHAHGGRFSSLVCGTHTIYVQGEDAAGNWGTLVSTTFTKDMFGPTTSGLTVSPSPTSTPPAITATVSDANDGHSNVIAAEYFIDTTGANGTGIPLSGAFTSTTVSVSGTLTASAFIALAQGTHTIYVQGEDAADNWGTLVSTTFVKDTVAPTVSGLTVTPSPTNTAPAITATISGSANIVAADYFIDTTGANGAGTALSGTFTSSTVSVSGTLTAAAFSALAQGTHTIYVQGEDAAGNWSTLVSTTFVKDTVAPTVSGLTVTPSPTNTAPAIAATISGSANIVAADYFIDTTGANGAGTALSGAFTSSTVSVSGTLTASAFSALAQGTHTIYVQGEDAAGNWSTLLSTTFVKDTVAPTVSGLTVTPSPTSTAPAIAATISGSANIVAADYFIDTTGANGAGTALSGTFTSSTVSVSGTLTAAAFTRPGPGHAHDLRAGRRRRGELEYAGLHDLRQGHGGPHGLGPDGDPQSDQHGARHCRHDQRQAPTSWPPTTSSTRPGPTARVRPSAGPSPVPR